MVGFVVEGGARERQVMSPSRYTRRSSGACRGV